jgi:hypothetical protein
MKIFALLVILVSATTNAFTIPHHGATSVRPALYNPITTTSSIVQTMKSTNHGALQKRGAKKGSIEEYAEETMAPSRRLPLSVVGFGGFALLLFTSICQKLQIYLNEPCLDGSSVCTEDYIKFASFFKEHETLGFGLLLTHAIPFALIPYTMVQIDKQGPIIKKDHDQFNPFVLQVAFACITFGLALEFGWHVSDSWYYGNDFHILNFGFYFFLISSFALWADGLKANPKMDVVFSAILLFATALYPAGNALEVGMDAGPFGELLGDAGASLAKIPLYLGMTVTFVSLTLRGQEIFGKKMWFTFFLSVVVNLSFIFLLAGYDYAKDPTAPLSEMNYIYHICHDVLGTELGVFYFGTLIRDYIPIAEREEVEA